MMSQIPEESKPRNARSIEIGITTADDSELGENSVTSATNKVCVIDDMVREEQNTTEYKEKIRRRESMPRLNISVKNWILKPNECHTASKKDMLYKWKRRSADLQFIFMLLGYILMISDNELFIAHYYTKRSLASILTKSFVSLSTVGLVTSVIAYEIVDIKILMYTRRVSDWRAAITKMDVFWNILQILICCVHTFPGDVKVLYTGDDGLERWVSIDAIMSIMMLFRLFIVGRFLTNHSFFMTDICTRTLCALNKVTYGGTFAFKAMMSSIPTQMILTLYLSNLVICSYGIHVCESYYDESKELAGFLESAWCISIDFNTGYPSSGCGHFVATAYHYIAMCLDALLIAVVTSKIMLTRSEHYVSNFSLRENLMRSSDHAKQKIVKIVVDIWKNRTFKKNQIQLKKQQRRLHDLIRERQNFKTDIRSVDESNACLINLYQSMNMAETQLHEVSNEYKKLHLKIDYIYSLLH